jgi:NAD(P)-dependent dehydrogenase (short-subunit alcohol dehydrogenase family)
MTNQRKVALVTGAGSGIGRATAEAFVARGYATVLADRDEAQGRAAAEALGADFIRCDVADEASVDAMIAGVVARHGRIDAAFNAAGIDGDKAPTADCTPENWDRVMAVNLRGLWLCLRREIGQMLAQGGGAIVNCASSTGLIGTVMMPAYVASKHGIVGLTRASALEYARSNIRINAVCPGMIDTPMWQKAITPELTAQLLANDPAGRLGQPSEIAAAVLWLCDDSASFVTGQALAVDGGMTIA